WPRAGGAGAAAAHPAGVPPPPPPPLPRPPLLPRLGDQGLPATTGAQSGPGGFLAPEGGDGGAGVRDAPLGAGPSASPAPHVWGGLLALLCPSHAAPPVHPLVLPHPVKRLHARRCVGEVTLPPPSGGGRAVRAVAAGGRRVANPAAGGLAGRGERPPKSRARHVTSPSGAPQVLSHSEPAAASTVGPRAGVRPRRAHPWGAPGLHGLRRRPGPRPRRSV